MSIEVSDAHFIIVRTLFVVCLSGLVVAYCGIGGDLARRYLC